MLKKRIFIGLLAFGLLGLGGCAQQGEQTTETSSTATNSDEVTIYLTRHGETMFNDLNKVQGWSDTPLTKEGEEVAVDLGRGLSQEDVTFQAVYSSDMKRSLDTADAILEGLDQETRAQVQEIVGLREAGSGQFEGESLDTIEKDQAKEAGYDSYKEYEEEKRKDGENEWSWLANAHYYADQSGYAEGADKVQERMTNAIEKIAENQSQEGGGNVLVVSHGMTINVMLADMTNKYEGEPLENASVTKIHYENGELNVESIGDTSYLEEEN